MINDLKNMNKFLLICICLLLGLNILLFDDLQKTTDRAEKLAAQVYTLGSMLGEQNAATQAKMIISEVNELD